MAKKQKPKPDIGELALDEYWEGYQTNRFLEWMFLANIPTPQDQPARSDVVFRWLLHMREERAYFDKHPKQSPYPE